jgi:hypothetical protein
MTRDGKNGDDADNQSSSDSSEQASWLDARGQSTPTPVTLLARGFTHSFGP